MASTLSLFADLEPESETVEYKESWHQDYLKSLAAFANTNGGVLRIGVKDKTREITGWSDRNKEQESISSSIIEILGIHPRRVEVEFHDGKPVLAIYIAKAATPVGVRGRYYRRVGNTTREVPDDERIRFLLEKTGQSWDELPCEPGVTDSILSEKTIATFRVLARERLPNVSVADTNERLLDKLGLHSEGGVLKRGAILLFAEEPQRLYRSTEVQVGRFKDAVTILDEQSLKGNLFEQLEQTLQQLRKYIQVRYDISPVASSNSPLENLQRREVWEYPLIAVREALLNALIHRDYTRHGSVTVRVFDDRMIISNPGGLTGGLTIQNLLEESHDSLRRNPILAEIVYYTKLIERWGTGTTRMRRACREQGTPDPEFQSTESSFTVILRKGTMSDAFPNALTDEEAGIIELVKSQGSLSTSETAATLNIPLRRASYLLQRLLGKGLLLAEGVNRWRRYRIGSSESEI